MTAVATICVVSFLYNAGQSTFDSFFPMYASGTLGMGPTKIGATLTSLAAVSFGVSAFVFSRVQDALGLTLTAAAGLGLVAAGLCGVGLAGSEAAAVAAAAVYVSGIPLFTPAVPILLMQCVPKTRRGAVMGLDSAVNAVARIATPVALGKRYAQTPRTEDSTPRSSPRERSWRSPRSWWWSGAGPCWGVRGGGKGWRSA